MVQKKKKSLVQDLTELRELDAEPNLLLQSQRGCWISPSQVNWILCDLQRVSAHAAACHRVRESFRMQN